MNALMTSNLSRHDKLTIGTGDGAAQLVGKQDGGNGAEVLEARTLLAESAAGSQGLRRS